jgi:soluble lytic murein transglycosylase-like protein
VALDTRLVARLLVDSVTQVESAGNPRMVGRHGERGLMQIKAGAWGDVTRVLFGRRISFERAFEGKLNQQVGAAYLAQLQGFLSRHQRVWKADERSLLLACYNAGPERVKRAGFDLRRLPAHTQDYVKRASALHDALLADHNVDPARVRLALTEQRPVSGGT